MGRVVACASADEAGDGEVVDAGEVEDGGEGLDGLFDGLRGAEFDDAAEQVVEGEADGEAGGAGTEVDEGA